MIQTGWPLSSNGTAKQFSAQGLRKQIDQDESCRIEKNVVDGGRAALESQAGSARRGRQEDI